jgi:hypothetical protein
MTPQEIAEFRELAGLNEPKSAREIEKEWADAQITNIPPVENQLPEPTMADFGNPTVHGQSYGGDSGIDKEIDGLANRLNTMLGNDFAATVKIERLQ